MTRCIQNELLRTHNCSLSLATIHKVLVRNDVRPIIVQRKKNTLSDTSDQYRVIEFKWIPVRLPWNLSVNGNVKLTH